MFPLPWCAASMSKLETKNKPSLLPGDPDAEFASSEMEDDSDVDVDELLQLDAKGNVINGNYGKVCACCLCACMRL